MRNKYMKIYTHSSTMQWLKKSESSGPRQLKMACQLVEKTHTHGADVPTKRNKKTRRKFSKANPNSSYFTILPFLIQKMSLCGCVVVCCCPIFKYISVTTYNILLYLGAFSWSFTYQNSFKQMVALFYEQLDATILMGIHINSNRDTPHKSYPLK